MYWLTQGLRVRPGVMATQHFKRNLLLNLYREGKTYHWFVSSCRLREIKMSGTCSLFPPFGDPWPSCLLPSQYYCLIILILLTLPLCLISEFFL